MFPIMGQIVFDLDKGKQFFEFLFSFLFLKIKENISPLAQHQKRFLGKNKKNILFQF